MVEVDCDNEDCENFGKQMEFIEDDSRGEWYEETYECEKCGKKKIHRTAYDQNGLVISDEIYDEVELK